MKTPLMTLIILLLGQVAGGAADEANTKINSLAARKSLQSYQAAIARAQEAFSKSVMPARRRLLDDLDQAERAATRRGDLDEANEIRSLRTTIGKTMPKPSLKNAGDDWTERIKRSSWVLSKGGDVWTFHADGSVECKDGNVGDGRWIPVGQRVIGVALTRLFIINFDADFETGTLFGWRQEQSVSRTD
jgi:hypothetical protein